MDAGAFCLDDYDCIGFDLDCTLVEYRVRELTKFIYESLAEFLVERKGHERGRLFAPFDGKENDFLRKGLFLDLERGNVLKIAENGSITKASHGTVELSEEKIVETYGSEKKFGPASAFVKDPLSLIDSPYEKMAKTTLDIFDAPCALLFARLVDRADEINGGGGVVSVVGQKYDFWPDILEALHHFYDRKRFAENVGGFFSAIKNAPHLYLKKWSPEKVRWLAELKKTKFVFLLTGSFIDFAALTASTVIGADWKDHFHVILSDGRKPFFFVEEHPFVGVNEKTAEETGTVRGDDLKINSVYGRGNWKDLEALASKHVGSPDPKCLYVGDNLIQDVYAPARFVRCDAVAVSRELKKEGRSDSRSRFWGPYFDTVGKSTTCWHDLIRRYAKICVSGVDVLVGRPFGFRYAPLKAEGSVESGEAEGYYVR